MHVWLLVVFHSRTGSVHGESAISFDPNFSSQALTRFEKASAAQTCSLNANVFSKLEIEGQTFCTFSGNIKEQIYKFK